MLAVCMHAAAEHHSLASPAVQQTQHSKQRQPLVSNVSRLRPCLHVFTTCCSELAVCRVGLVNLCVSHPMHITTAMWAQQQRKQAVGMALLKCGYLYSMKG